MIYPTYVCLTYVSYAACLSFRITSPTSDREILTAALIRVVSILLRWYTLRRPSFHVSG